MRLTYLVFALLGLFWGSNFIYMKWAAELITPAQITLLRVFFGFLPLAFVAWRKGVIHQAQVRHLPHFLVMAVLATAFYYFAIAEGTALLPSGIAGILGGSISLFTTIATLLFLRTEKPNALMLAGVLVGFAGIVLIARPWEGTDRTIDLAGVSWMLAATTILGVSYVYVRRFLSPYNLPPLALATWQTGLALAVLLLVVDPTGTSSILQNWHAAAGVAIGLGVFGTGMAFLIYYYLLQELGAVAASGATYITPNVALLIGWANGERVGVPELAAIILVLASIAMLQIGRQQAVKQAEQRVAATVKP
ncbi:DMT family transporter [Agrobacterium vitis]|uniref:DMT family transporter n=1 Tax=Rhizobium/Agrobacterium group TaxID=227290 RepID=UPI0012E890E4|nr:MULTISPECIES: DMT family transporter [Rhizobium/Agrobacterium group]MCF1450653.1 DMT family transporter [Allorhizobium ampelinum]MVA72104.1 EamA family transporter [Agrobacterium vitis]